MAGIDTEATEFHSAAFCMGDHFLHIFAQKRPHEIRDAEYVGRIILQLLWKTLPEEIGEHAILIICSHTIQGKKIQKLTLVFPHTPECLARKREASLLRSTHRFRDTLIFAQGCEDDILRESRHGTLWCRVP